MKNRKLKFRAWDKETKTFGFFAIKNFFIEGDDDYEGHTASINTWRWKKGANGRLGDYYEFSIDTADIEKYPITQYTGLKDKNGKDIYEGDIIDCLIKGKYKVIFYNGGFVSKNKEGLFLGIKYCELGNIIGNIYQNKNLLNNKIKI